MDLKLTTEKSNTVHLTVYGSHPVDSPKYLIYVHGFKGFKDWGFVPHAADYFANSGYFVITFNFSHNGVGENSTNFNELDLFAENTISLEVEELKEIINKTKNGFFGNSENCKIGIIGHSRGGADVLLAASNNSDVNAVATWASIAKLDRFSKRQKNDWKEKGVFEVLNSRTNQLMKMNYSFLKDIEENQNDSLNIQKAVENLSKPLLIAHGDQDLAVPIKEGEQIYEWADKQNTEFYKLIGTGHTFGAVHPFEKSNEKLERLLETTLKYFNHKL